jgi:hypothetical protein
MASWHLEVIHDCVWAQLVPDPVRILWADDKVIHTHVQRNWDLGLFDFLEIDFRWSWGTIHLHVLLGAVVVLLELRALDHLTKMQEALETCSSWIVSKVSSESIKIQRLRSGGGDIMNEVLADTSEVAADLRQESSLSS